MLWCVAVCVWLCFACVRVCICVCVCVVFSIVDGDVWARPDLNAALVLVLVGADAPGDASPTDVTPQIQQVRKGMHHCMIALSCLWLGCQPRSWRCCVSRASARHRLHS